MKTMKRILAFTLAFVLILTGICFTAKDGSEAKAENTEETATPDTPVAGMLDIKFQTATTTDGETVMRFITSVNGLNYQTVGLEVTPSGKETLTYTTQTVYKRILSSDKGMEYEFSPKVVDTSSEYLVTAKMLVDESESYTVQAFVIPLGGTEADKVYGQARYVKFADGAVDASNYTYNQAETGTTVLPLVGGLVGNVASGAKIYVDDLLNVGEVKYNSSATGGYGSIVGYMDGSLGSGSDVCATAQSCEMTTNAASNLNNIITTVLKADITGTADTVKKNLAGFDFETYWSLTKTGTPILKVFQ